MPSIGEIDKNLKVETKIEKPDIRFIDVRECTDIDIYGLWNPRTEKIFRRVPEDIARATNPGVAELAQNTAGGHFSLLAKSRFFPSCLALG